MHIVHLAASSCKPDSTTMVPAILCAVCQQAWYVFRLGYIVKRPLFMAWLSLPNKIGCLVVASAAKTRLQFTLASVIALLIELKSLARS